MTDASFHGCDSGKIVDLTARRMAKLSHRSTYALIKETLEICDQVLESVERMRRSRAGAGGNG